MSTTLEKPPVKSKEPKAQNPPTSLASSITFSGPTPPPQVLEYYERLVPGSAKRFLDEPHLEAEHRRSLERSVVQERIRLSKRGQVMAFILASFCIIMGFVAIFYEHDLAGLGAVILSIGSLIGIFLYSRRSQS
jgi:uncharacterized membrane protein